MKLMVAITSLRCRIDRLLVELFCDYSFKKDFLYSASGLALLEPYGCQSLQNHQGRVRGVLRVYEESGASDPEVPPAAALEGRSKLRCSTNSPRQYIETLELHLRQLVEDWRRQIRAEDRHGTRKW